MGGGGGGVVSDYRVAASLILCLACCHHINYADLLTEILQDEHAKNKVVYL